MIGNQHTHEFSLKTLTKKFQYQTRYFLALSWHYWYWLRHRFQLVANKYCRAAPVIAVCLWIYISTWLLPYLQSAIGAHFAGKDEIDDFQGFMLALGGALIGATAIAFTFIMFAMQVNVERMPHGLFRKFSTDKRLMSTFIIGFLLAIGIAGASLISNPLWIAKILWATTWVVFIILIDLLYAYRRALLLINPVYQLGLVVIDARSEMKIWSRRAKRAAPLLQNMSEIGDKEAKSYSTDLTRTAYFKLNPYWTTQSERSVRHIISYARRYAEKGDHEVSAAALEALTQINRLYVSAKGKTFFADDVPFLENPLLLTTL